MAITPISGTDTVSFINDPVGNKANALVVIPVNADGSAMGGGTSSSPEIVGGVATSSPPTLTNGQTAPLQLTNNGQLAVALVSSSGSIVATGTTAADAVATSAAALGVRGFGYVFNGSTWDRQRGDTTGAYVVQKGTATVANGQTSVATTNTQIVAARTGRGRVTITNLGTTDVFIGATGVTTTTGQLLAGTKGASITLHTSAAIFGIVGTGTQSVSYIEEY